MIAGLLGLLWISAATPAGASGLAVGAVHSSAQTTSKSFLRFYNAGQTAGEVGVTLHNAATGEKLGQWISPAIPAGAEHQFAIDTIESGAGNFAKPPYYAITVQSNISGYFQHVLYRSALGTLTNLSTCAAGVTADPASVSAVHSGLFASGYPSAVVVNNTGSAAATVSLAVYDARDGTKRGTYTTSTIPANGQIIVAVAAMEAAVGAPTVGMLHYVVKAEGAFTGFLQHLVNNTRAGITTDMTTMCGLEKETSAAAALPLRSGAIFSTAQTASRSFLRFYNSGSSAGTVLVTLNDSANGQALGQWTSPAIPAGSEQQYAIDTIESALDAGAAKPDYYTISVQSGITGFFQHVLWRAEDSTLTNLSTCSAGVTASATKLAAVHSSLFGNNFPSTLVVHNTGASASSVVLGIYDARDGVKRGTYTSAAIPSEGHAEISVAEIEAAVGPPAAGMYHYVVKIESVFTGYLQHLVNNAQSGVITDMTTSCALAVQSAAGSLTFASNNAGARLGTSCQAGQTAMDGFLLVCASTGKFRYALADDIPQAPQGGHVTRPAWYPPLGATFRAENPPSCPASGRITLTSMIVPLDALATSTAQGAMIFDHVTPIDHAYIAIKPLDKPLAERTEADYVPVFAPADAEIIEISLLGSPRSIRVVMAHGCETYTVIMVLNQLSGVLAGYQTQLLASGRVTNHISVHAGEKIGEQRDNPLDFAVNDGAVWLPGYVSPFSYADGEAWKPYTADPFPYFTPDLAAALEAKMRRTEAPRWGKIDHDVAGTASGGWFLDGTVGYSGRTVAQFSTATQSIPGGPVAGRNYTSWSHLAIARHWDLPANWVFSTGWWREPNGDPVQMLMEIPDGTPAPSDLKSSSGIAVYRLRFVPNANAAVGGVFTTNGLVQGIVAVQVNDDETLTIEPVPGEQNAASFTGFTAAKRLYRR